MRPHARAADAGRALRFALLPAASPRAAPAAVATLVAFALNAVLAPSASAQSAGAVLLQVRPRLGDTLRMRLDQRVEMSGVTRVRGADETRTMTTLLQVFSHAVVEGRDDGGSLVTATTDSVVLVSDSPDSAIAAREARRALQGRRVRLRVGPDGATEAAGGGSSSSASLDALLAQMPASLPRDGVEVGERWTRSMTIPVTGAAGGRGTGTLRATFRLDSLGAGGRLAYLSMHGVLSRDAAPVRDTYGGILEMSGSVTGTLVLDRRRGWVSDARTLFTIRSLMTPAAGQAGAPMQLRMKVTQWMRLVK